MTDVLPWFRMYHEFASDPVIRLLSFDDQRHFVFVLCMKCRGDLDKDYPEPAVRLRTIAGTLGVSLTTLDEIRRRLTEVGLIDDNWQPRNWDKRQMRSDSSVERVRKHREAKRAEEARKRAAAVAECNRYGNGLDTEKELEKRNTPQHPSGVTPQGVDQPQDEPSAGRKGRRNIATATRLPADFELTPDRRAIATAEGLDADREFAKFGDHFRAAPGPRGRKVDWDATWRNWCRNAHDRGPPGKSARGPAPVTEQDQERRNRELRKLAHDARIFQAAGEDDLAFLARVEGWNQRRIARLS